MQFKLNRVMQMTAAMFAVGVLAACGSSSNDDSADNGDDNMAVFSLAVSDAPVDAAERVLVCFESV